MDLFKLCVGAIGISITVVTVIHIFTYGVMSIKQIKNKKEDAK